ncbi:diaminopimelate epimerase [Cytobacillus gottheilii]|uniref:Diaminopimelate epimerase n=1 Tax=Cytobacillus gottheilii TaxID=859144 RepID=A0ABX8FA41_9BACI|nr:diaminopimelate epimerase [Cytobacillus gottheilii]QVY60012.1 diaminopimelate epimerase [Cytobacillus gottheilii]
MEFNVIKCHGSGNDFFIIDEMTHPYELTDQQRSSLTILLCNRQSELGGADGILFVQASERADARMRVFNSDGSEASMCGNGLRCVARYVCEKLSLKEAVIETMKADLQVSVQNDLYDGVPTYLVEISPISFNVKDLPLHIEEQELIQRPLPALSEDLEFTALAVPNPHIIAVVEKEQLQSDIQKGMSEYVNGPNDLFPDGVNVSFVLPLRKGHIYVRTFERGVGFTNACGTAMSASSLVTCLLELNNKGEIIEVYNNGGKVRCVVHEDHIDLIGNASYVFSCQVNADLNANEFKIKNKEEYTEEIAQYKELEMQASSFLREYL